MDEVIIRLKNDQNHFTVGETIDGTAEVTLPDDLTLANVTISFHCIGEVKWIEYPRTPAWMDGCIYNEEVKYHEVNLNFNEKDVKVENNLDNTKFVIPFAFTIPKEKNLPSSMTSKQGFIKYFVRVSIKNDDDEKVKHFSKDLIVDSPIDKNLMITVGGTAEKVVLFHHGTATMHASLDRKGYTPGERITVHILVDNKTNTKLVPQIALQQVQIYMSGIRHKTVQQTISAEPVSGEEVPAHTEHGQVNLEVTIPADQQLSIKSSVISIKYFVHVTLKIPHSLDLHVNLPVVITTRKVIEELAGEILQNCVS